ncbi:hypothetical protein [Clostridium vincentii]|uniref:Uncharacterized protein n=1 Tax=Clostridium vincentii TaxID=52704 RepID=A0A2T0BBZ1_9CLOT|nr:hypothetical protein [Clostridium vincentii]PRR81327.1 hypothetical protein CLVI_25600 [Clostridium vincentii]
MSSNFIKATDVAKELGVYLKVVTSTKSFDNYNSFFNIFTEMDEPCRRIVVLTPYQELEEVNDEDPSKPINKYRIIDSNLWIEEYSLLHNPSKISLDDVKIPEEVYINFKNQIN